MTPLLRRRALFARAATIAKALAGGAVVARYAPQLANVGGELDGAPGQLIAQGEALAPVESVTVPVFNGTTITLPPLSQSVTGFRVYVNGAEYLGPIATAAADARAIAITGFNTFR